MNINETLAGYSDLAFQTAFAIYVLALILQLAQYATKRADTVAPREAVLVGAGGPPTVVPSGPVGPVPGKLAETPKRPWSDRLGNMTVAVLWVGLAVDIASIVLRGFATHRFPLGNMYEFVTMACAGAVLVGLVVMRSPKYRTLWVFLLLPVLVLEFLAATLLYTTAAPVVPALRSYWLPIHVTIVSLGSGVFLVSGVASAMFLLRLREPQGAESDTLIGRIAARLPDARALDRLAYLTTVIGFPLFGAGVILGAIWAESAWGRFWGWDPKETMAFIAWVIYAAYLHARATAGWRDRKAAWINIAGFVAMLFNLFVINIVVSGLHSYAGLN